MAVRIRLTDGSAFVVDSAFSDLHEQVVKAIAQDVPLIEVRNGSGKLRSINPRQIAVLEEPDDETLTPGEEQVLEAVRDPQPQE